jgi:truncated hemoglobin YjbI
MSDTPSIKKALSRRIVISDQYDKVLKMESSIPLNRPDLARLLTNIGGANGLREILLDFYARMAADTMLGFFFSGKDLNLIAEKQEAFLLRAMGATPSYSGKPPAQAHDELPPILAGHFDRRLRILEETLLGRGVKAEDIRTWVAFESAFRSAIVSKT